MFRSSKRFTLHGVCLHGVAGTSYMYVMLRIALLFTSDKGEGKCFARLCLSVCLSARLLKKACMDLDEMLRVDRCRDMDELINF